MTLINEAEILKAINLPESEISKIKDDYFKTLSPTKRFIFNKGDLILRVMAGVSMLIAIGLAFLVSVKSSLIGISVCLPACVAGIFLTEVVNTITNRLRKEKISENLKNFNDLDIYNVMNKNYDSLNAYQRFYLRNYLKSKSFDPDIIINIKEVEPGSSFMASPITNNLKGAK